MTSLQTQQEAARERFDEMVRDFTDHGFMAKSKARGRFEKLIAQAFHAGQMEGYARGRQDEWHAAHHSFSLGEPCPHPEKDITARHEK